MNEYVNIFILATICGSIAYTMTESGIFEPYRIFCKNVCKKLGELSSCGYCTGHWVAFFLVAVYQPRIVHSSFWLLDYFLTAILIAWISGLWWRFHVFVGQVIVALKEKNRVSKEERLAMMALFEEGKNTIPQSNEIPAIKKQRANNIIPFERTNIIPFRRG
ncbi:MAG: DUF1360 domain-containing protein [Nanoarchaeota archaeon]|nr:DUF1360 domain-containing protein [Nanoarchaeota archaeon]